MSEQKDGTKPLLMWIVQALLGLVMFFLGIYVKSVSDALAEAQREIDLLKQPVFQTEQNVKNLEGWLNRVEAKIDRAIEATRP